MVTLVIALAVGFPLIVVIALGLVRRSQRRTAVRDAAEILELELDERGLSLPHLSGKVDGVDVRVEKSPRDWGAMAKAVFGFLLDNAASRPTSVGWPQRGTAKSYTAPYGPITVVVSPYGFPPEVELKPSETRKYGPVDEDENPLRVSFEDAFDMEATHDEYVHAILEHEGVMQALWSMHKEYQSIRCKNGEVHVQLDPLRTGREVAGDVRSVVERAHAIGAVFERHPIRA
jgi:hypothetical protein